MSDMSEIKFLHVGMENILLEPKDILTWWQEHPDEFFCTNLMIVGNQESIVQYMKNKSYDVKEIEDTINEAFGIENKNDEDFLTMFNQSQKQTFSVTTKPVKTTPKNEPINLLKWFNSRAENQGVSRVRLLNSKNEEKTSPKKGVIIKNTKTENETSKEEISLINIKNKLKDISENHVIDITKYDWKKGTGSRVIKKPSNNDQTVYRHESIPVVSKTMEQLEKLALHWQN